MGSTRTRTTNYVYGSGVVNPKAIAKVKYNGYDRMYYTYDKLYRLSEKKVGGENGIVTSYSYLPGYTGGGILGATTTLVQSETIGNDTYTYTYDNIGNITSVSLGNNVIREYTYDSLGEMTSEDIKGQYKVVYEYDYGGNITSRTKYLYSGGVLQTTGTTVNYTYGDTAWKDLLTSYDGNTITYDNIGNPTTYYTGDTFTWVDGRSLASISGATNAAFTYSGGIRIKKIAGGITHEYLVAGSQILREKRSDGVKLYFYYDQSGNLSAFKKDGQIYFYVRNILGEIVGIIDTNGDYVVKYTYDAWGKSLTKTDGAGNNVANNPSHLANVNPFRYKGYYYDSEINMYYLQSRYYDPAIGRFISADHPDCLGVNDDFTSFNLFAYCGNNPLMRVDESGDWWLSAIIGAVVGVAVQYVSDVVTNLAEGKSFIESLTPRSSIADYGAAALSGALAGSGIGLVASVASNAAISGTQYVANCAINGEQIDPLNFGASVLIGGATGLIGGEGANLTRFRGVKKTAKTVLETAVSPRKIAMYTAKTTAVKKALVISTARFVLAGASNNYTNYKRKQIFQCQS